jgi:hypothetical protein
MTKIDFINLLLELVYQLDLFRGCHRDLRYDKIISQIKAS